MSEMTVSPLAPEPVNPDYAPLVDALADRGYVVLDHWLSPDLVNALREELQSLSDSALTPAAIGRGSVQHIESSIRRDRTRWLNGGSAPQQQFLTLLERLRLEINRTLFMGLFEVEAHYAWYPPGAFYARHYDAFAGGDSNRVLSCVFYLNNEWQAADGGELVICDRADRELCRVPPEAGRAVMFLSEQFPHEVLPARRDRYSIAAWYRVNSSHAQRVDPPR